MRPTPQMTTVFDNKLTHATRHFVRLSGHRLASKPRINSATSRHRSVKTTCQVCMPWRNYIQHTLFKPSHLFGASRRVGKPKVVLVTVAPSPSSRDSCLDAWSVCHCGASNKTNSTRTNYGDLCAYHSRKRQKNRASSSLCTNVAYGYDRQAPLPPKTKRCISLLPSSAHTETTGGARTSGMRASICRITPCAYSVGVAPEMSDLFAATTSARPSAATTEEEKDATRDKLASGKGVEGGTRDVPQKCCVPTGMS